MAGFLFKESSCVYCYGAAVWATIELDYEFSPEILINRGEHWGQAQLNTCAHYIRIDCICSTAPHSTTRAVINRQPLKMDRLKIVDLEAGVKKSEIL